MPALALHVEVKFPMTRRWFLAYFKEGALDHDFAIGQITYLREEVSGLHLRANDLWIVVDFDFFCEDATFFILFLNEIIPNLDDFLDGFVLTHDFRLVLLNCIDYCRFCDFLNFFVGKALLSGLICRFLTGCYSVLSGDWVFLKCLNQLVMLLFKLFFFTLLQDFGQFFVVLVVFVFTNAVAEAFAKLESLLFDLLIFFLRELVTLSSIPDVAPALLNVAILELFLVEFV